MNEEHWLVCKDPKEMVEFLICREGGADERKLRLFVVACARGAWEAIEDPRSFAILEVAERHADGLATQEEWDAACGAARAGMGAGEACLYAASPRAADAALLVTHPNVTYYDPDAGCIYSHFDAARTTDYSQVEAWSAGRAVQADMLRDLFGNPFREPTPIAPSLLMLNGAPVVRLAQAAYDERLLDNCRLAILADALEEIGGTDSAILGHLRSGHEHWRGCWAVDSILRRG
jgi:hypothetical protein